MKRDLELKTKRLLKQQLLSGKITNQEYLNDLNFIRELKYKNTKTNITSTSKNIKNIVYIYK